MSLENRCHGVSGCVRSSKGNHLSLEGRCYGVFFVKLVMACCRGSFYVHRVLSEFGKLVVMVCLGYFEIVMVCVCVCVCGLL